MPPSFAHAHHPGPALHGDAYAVGRFELRGGGGASTLRSAIAALASIDLCRLAEADASAAAAWVALSGYAGSGPFEVRLLSA